MINIRIFTLVLVSVTFCLAGHPRGALGQEADGKLVARYTGLMNQLRAELTAKLPAPGNEPLVTMNYEQMLNVAANDDTAAITIVLPFTCGEWQNSEPVMLNLKQGENVLKFSRMNAPQYGVAVKSFTLKPSR